MTVKFRYKKPDEDKSRLIVQTLEDKKLKTDQTSDDFRWSAAVAAFGMMLRESDYLNGFNATEILELAKSARGRDTEGYRAEFIRMMKSDALIAKR